MKICKYCRKLIQKRIDYLENLDKRGILRDTAPGHSRRVAIQQLKHLLMDDFDYDLKRGTELDTDEVIKQAILKEIGEKDTGVK